MRRDTRRAARHAKRYGHELAAWPVPAEPEPAQHAARHAEQTRGDLARVRKLQQLSPRR